MSTTPTKSPKSPKSTSEETLREELRSAAQSLRRKEPLDPTYRRLLLRGTVTSTTPKLPNDPLYKRVPSDLRGCVETFLQQTAGKDPFDRISQRQPIEEDQMRVSLNLREEKEHDQKKLLEATLAQFPRRCGMDVATRRKHMNAVAAGLQMDPRQRNAATPQRPPAAKSQAAKQTEQARQKAERDRQEAMAKAREQDRLKRREEERLAENKSRQKSPKDSAEVLQKLCYPIFTKLWNMEFPKLGGTNPFRVVIDRDNCASVGAADYFDVIEKPMNLTYIKKKVENYEYGALQEFFGDVQLMIQNAIKYNSDPNSLYRAAAKEMKKVYVKERKDLVRSLSADRQE